ncbi:MAG: hypothetical protein SVZ03_13195 [Spirochaetota bacterium]|nr:hypothetical protein [Spirochaetota bacterium]
MRQPVILNALIFVIILLTSCKHNIRLDNYTLGVFVPLKTHKKIGKKEIEDIFHTQFKFNRDGSNLLELVIYGYCSGKETFVFSGDTDNNITRDIQKGSIEALLKIKREGKLEKIFFLKASGSDQEELIDNLVLETKKILNFQ